MTRTCWKRMFARPAGDCRGVPSVLKDRTRGVGPIGFGNKTSTELHKLDGETIRRYGKRKKLKTGGSVPFCRPYESSKETGGSVPFCKPHESSRETGGFVVFEEKHKHAHTHTHTHTHTQTALHKCCATQGWESEACACLGSVGLVL